MSTPSERREIEMGCTPFIFMFALLLAIAGGTGRIAEAIEETKTCPTPASTR